MAHWTGIGGLVVLALAGVAHAQTAAPPPMQTVLELGADGAMPAVPDRLQASLHVTARGGTAAAVSAAVDRQTARARQAATAPDVVFTAGSMQVQQLSAPESGWQGDQSITLTGKTAASDVLGDLGRMQALGVVTDGMGWTLPPERQAALRQQAVAAALASLRTQAGAAAAALGLHLVGFRRVAIDPVGEGVVRPMMAMAMARAAPTPQVDVPQDATIAAHVTAEAMLQP